MNISSGSRSTISVAGTRLSEHPIQKYCGPCWPTRGLKNVGSTRILDSAQARLWANSSPGLLSDGVASGTCATSSKGARSEEHTSELQSLMRISYAVFCLTKKNRYGHAKHALHHTIK